MNLIKIYDKTCTICSMLAGIDEQIAEDHDLFFRKIELSELAKNPSQRRDYVVAKYVVPNDGDIDLPLYLIENRQGNVEASGIVKTAEEIKNLIEAWRKWESSRKS